MVKPDFRESLSTIVAMQLLQGESRYMMVPLLVLSLMGTDFSKQRPCESIDTRNPCEMRRDCCWQTKYTKIEKMLGPVWKRSEWCEECPTGQQQRNRGRRAAVRGAGISENPCSEFGD